VNVESVPYEALHDKIVAAAPAGTYDVVLVDVIWPSEFASKGMLADLTDRIPAEWKTEVLPGALNSGAYQGKYYGVPWLLDTKYFYANSRMLAKAGVDKGSLTTWKGAVEAARALKSKGVVEYPFLWSWSQAEALICDYAALTASFGGTLFDPAGKPAFTSGGAVSALEFMKSTIDDKLTNPASMESLEDDVRKSMSAGSSALGLNWTYMYAQANDAKESKEAGNITISPVPDGGGGRISVNGSMALTITAGSSQQDAAWTYVQYLASKPVQEQYVADSLPIWVASYQDPAVIKSAPEVVAAAKDQLADMTNRPEVPAYNTISQLLQVELQKALLGQKPAQQALNDAATAVNKAIAQA
jgi:multiple sugar transport system substrate-binding protein